MNYRLWLGHLDCGVAPDQERPVGRKPYASATPTRTFGPSPIRMPSRCFPSAKTTSPEVGSDRCRGLRSCCVH
jgi:hypothetical protein